jgi:hypothetical protein
MGLITKWIDRQEPGVGHQLTHAGSSRTGTGAPLGPTHYQLIEHHVSSSEEKHGTAQPFCLTEKMLVGKRSQDEMAPRPVSR